MNAKNKIKGLLLQSGLSESEATVYQALLDQPAEVAYDLVKRTGLSKSSLYRAVENLKSHQMVTEQDGVLKAASLKTLVSNLDNSSRKLGKLANQLRKISPFLHLPTEAVDEFEQFYGREQVIEQYLKMSELDYDVNLDFGDFESVAPQLGGFPITDRFRENRIKKATHKGILTNFGPYTAHYTTVEAEKVFKNNIKLMDLNFRNRFIVFSDMSDYSLFINSEDDELLSAVLVKSKLVSDMQRRQFDSFSHILGN